jgi:hypothetical protein
MIYLYTYIYVSDATCPASPVLRVYYSTVYGHRQVYVYLDKSVPQTNKQTPGL